MSDSFSFKTKKEHVHAFFAVVLVTVLVALSVLRPFGVPRAGAVGFDTGYAYRKSITIDLLRVPDTEPSYANFPILVSFTHADFVRDTDCTIGSPPVDGPCNSSGFDIVFTDSDGTTQLAHEIEVYDGAPGQGRVVMWVRIPTLPSTGANKVIYVYYGNNSISTFQGNVTSNGVTGVWDNNYMGVWHLDEVVPNPHQDSSQNPVNSSAITVGAQGTAVGIAGGADQFTLNTQRITFPDSTKWDNTDMRTLEAWVNETSPTSGIWHTVVARPNAAVTDYDYSIFVAKATTNIPSCYYGGSVADSSVDITSGTWAYLACAMNGSSIIYIDGVNRGTGPALTVNLTTIPLYIGDPAGDAFNEAFIGIVDEVRVSDNVRTPGWLETTYNTIRYPGPAAPDPFDFYGVGIEEVGNLPPTTPTLAETPAFANKDTSDTTPDLGTFVSTDTELNPIEYEIEWATNPGFTIGVVTKNSVNHAAADNGFIQPTYASGADVTYTPTGVGNDVFTIGTTYWWHVRAKDTPPGSDTSSIFSAPRSFTIGASADAWLQTTSDQFTTTLTDSDNILTDTEASSPGGVKLKGW